jgi:hypothetical protein
MYQDRLTLFLDILGFRNLINSIGQDQQKITDLYDLLTSLTSEMLGKEKAITINESVIPQEELDDVRKTAELLSQRLSLLYPIEITHFSDSVVLSAQISNHVSCLNILDLTARLYVRIWEKYGLLLRGGLSVGKLVHIENGPLFGPAMIKSYDIESKVAVYPRVAIDSQCYNFIKSLPTFEAMSFAINDPVNDSHYYIDLSSSFNFIVFKSLHSIHREIFQKNLNLLLETPNKLQNIIDKASEERIAEKYTWTKVNIEKLLNKNNLLKVKNNLG